MIVKEEMKKEEVVEIVEVGVGRNDLFVFFDEKCASWNSDTKTLSYCITSTKQDGCNYAICSYHLRDLICRWKVTVLDLPDNMSLYMGIIGTNNVRDIRDANSIAHCTSCMWGSGYGLSLIRVNGMNDVESGGGTWRSKEDSGRGGTNGGSVWRKGDEAYFSYFPSSGQLEMKRYNTVYTINTRSTSFFSSLFSSRLVYPHFYFDKEGARLKIE